MNTQELKAIVTSIIEAPSCCPEMKQVGQEWLEAAGTDKETAATEKLLAEAKADIITIDALIGFTASEAGVKLFGPDFATQLHEHGVEIKAQGAEYCDCPACAGCLQIIKG